MEKMKLKILKSLVTNHAVLKDLGYTVPKVLTVAVPDGQIKKFIKYMDSPNAKKLTMYANHESIDRALATAFSSAVLITYSKGTLADASIDYIFSIMNLGDAGGTTVEGIPIFVTEKEKLGEVKKEQFVIILDDNSFTDSISFSEIVPPAEMLPVVFDKIIHTVNVDSESPIKKSLKAALCFMYPMGGNELMELGLRCVDEICRCNEEIQDVKGLAELFICELQEFQRNQKFSEVYPIEYIESDPEHVKQAAILYSSNNIYMGESLFKKVVEKFTNRGIPIEGIKRSLAEERILIPNQDSSYTVKVMMTFSNGNKERIRVLRFCRERLHEAGEPDLIDICENRRGGENYVEIF